ncbi:hypothetical protein Tco_0955708 [Tanacetum coccineum]|uniref:Uncharacterized protein n=1 Tax=Tanacetum coccineum TaxID=301880 RepID=A0ABQ5E7Z2_9ASTR
MSPHELAMRENAASCQAWGGKPLIESQTRISSSLNLLVQGLRVLKQDFTEVLFSTILVGVLVFSSRRTHTPPRYFVLMSGNPLSSKIELSTVTEDPKSRSAQVEQPSQHLDDHADFGSIIWRHPWDTIKTLVSCARRKLSLIYVQLLEFAR